MRRGVSECDVGGLRQGRCDEKVWVIMRRLIGSIAVFVCVVTGTGLGSVSRNAEASAAASGSVRLYVEPQDSMGFAQRALSSAKVSIDMSMYELVDSQLVSTLVSRARGGVKVRVLLDQAYHGSTVNLSAFNDLRSGGVAVAWAPARVIYHAKYFVIDRDVLYLGTGNLTAKYYSSTRDFWVADTSSRDVSDVEQAFASDFSGHNATARHGSALVWSPQATSAYVGFIQGAKKTLVIENEEMSSYAIEDALVAAAKRGVRVEVIMNASTSGSGLAWLASHGVSVHVMNSSGLYIHAKVMCRDCESGSSLASALVGSQNFSTTSLTYNRELAITSNATSVIQRLRSVLTSDWNASKKYR